MKLLIKRDRTYLEKTEGRANVGPEVPEFLKTPRVVPHSIVRLMDERSTDDDLLIADNLMQMEYRASLRRTTEERLPALWSGYRSVIVRDEQNDRYYRLKGVSLNPENPELTKFEDGTVWIQGGQKRSNGVYEKKMSDRFNRVLANEGIQPVMNHVGEWVYPKKVKHTYPSASIFEIKGDTRLDELMFVLENLALSRCSTTNTIVDGKKLILPFNQTGERFFGEIKIFYSAIGYVVGKLKRLMDHNGQTWSCDSERSNAHIGNIALYSEGLRRIGSDIKVGFVDFDASCDEKELSKSEIADLHKKEFETLINSVYSGPISPREIGGFLSEREKGGFIELRQSLAQAIHDGYNSPTQKYFNEIAEVGYDLRGSSIDINFDPREFETLYGTILSGILETLHSRVWLTEKPEKVKRPVEKPIYEYTESLEQVLYQNYKYQQGLSRGKSSLMNYLNDDCGIFKPIDKKKKKDYLDLSGDDNYSLRHYNRICDDLYEKDDYLIKRKSQRIIEQDIYQ